MVAIVTQGRYSSSDWTSKYRLLYSDTQKNWRPYLQDGNIWVRRTFWFVFVSHLIFIFPFHWFWFPERKLQSSVIHLHSRSGILQTAFNCQSEQKYYWQCRWTEVDPVTQLHSPQAPDSLHFVTNRRVLPLIHDLYSDNITCQGFPNLHRGGISMSRLWGGRADIEMLLGFNSTVTVY